MIEVIYVHHDCFLIRTPKVQILTDWYTDCGESVFDSVDPDVPIYFLVSHHHKDHFSPRIFGLGSRFPMSRYIISKDTARAARHYFAAGSSYRGPLRAEPDRVTVLSPGECAELDGLTVRAFGSTDTGNSYLIETDGRRLFHAGDLNAWIWRDESTDEEVRDATETYLAIVDEIATVAPRIDLVMFPVDARLGTDYPYGARLFVRRIDVGLFLPMHFCLGTDAAENERFRNAAGDFRLYADPERGRYALLSRAGDKVAF